MLDIVSLKKYYATQRAVDDISFRVPKGAIFGLLGPNGAGKSSLLRMITGITMPDSGSILLDGEAFQLDKHSRDIGYMPEERGLYKRMKVEDQAMYLAQLKGLTRQEAATKLNAWFKKLEMDSWRNKKVEDLSKGMSQKLQFVITVLHEPKLLILDEPFSGLDPVNSAIIKEEIHALSARGTTIIFSTHRMEQVEEICKEIVLMNQGKLILEGDVMEVKKRFRQNKYHLEIDGELPEHPHLHCLRAGVYEAQFASQDEADEIIRYCLQNKIRISNYHEVLPSLHDIFIQSVEGKGGAARSFENPIH